MLNGFYFRQLDMTDEAITQKKLSRRQFMGTAAAGAVALGAVAGATSLLPRTSAAAATGTGTAPAAQIAKAQAVMAQPSLPSQWDVAADVVVVGTGVAGFGAAIEAYDNGASVVIIEKENEFFGGNSMFAGGNWQIPVSYIQAAAGIEDHVAWAIEDYQINGGYRNNVDLLELFCSNAKDTLLWAQNLGIVWNPTPNKQGDDRVARVDAPIASPNYPGNAGISEIYIMNQALNNRGVKVQLGKKMTQIYRTPSGPVVGIQVLDVPSGNVLNYKANRAVVLATGGFKANPQMVQSFHPLLDEDFIWSGYPYTHTTGDGHVAAIQVGAGEVDCSWPVSFSNVWGTSIHQLWTPMQLVGPPSGIPPIIAPGVPYTATNPWAILVAGDGNRFLNEALWGAAGTPPGANDAQVYSVYMQAYLQIPFRPRNVWAVVDANGAKALNWTLAEFQAATVPTVTPYLDPAYIAWSSTISGLADQMAISETNLTAAVARWNGFVSTGTDGDFGRPAPLNPISTPPYMAAKFVLASHDQSGGIRVNTNMQVIDCQNYQLTQGSGPQAPLDQEAVIPRLYAAGEVAGGFWGMARGDGKMGSYCVVGRVAGANAAAEIPLT
jgi:succinate dehydrogenase/fumarate reductase flavoprotein subunit